MYPSLLGVIMVCIQDAELRNDVGRVKRYPPPNMSNIFVLLIINFNIAREIRSTFDSSLFFVIVIFPPETNVLLISFSHWKAHKHNVCARPFLTCINPSLFCRRQRRGLVETNNDKSLLHVLPSFTRDII
jgi:hypothetical protein